MALSLEQLLEALVCDPTSSHVRGRLIAYERMTDDPTEKRLIQGRLAVGGPSRRPVEIPVYRSPAVAVPHLIGEKRDLTVGEVTWLATMDDDPSKISDTDAQALATLREQVRTPVERSMVDRRLDPVREFHGARQRASALEREVVSVAVAQNPLHAGPHGASPSDWSDWRDLLTQRVRAEIPALHETEAGARAQRLVEERWQTEGVEASQRREALRAELGEVVRAHGITSTVFPDADKWGTAEDPGYRPPVEA